MSGTEHQSTPPVATLPDVGDPAATAKVAGEYTFRFNGFTMAYGRLWYLAGLGHFHIDPDGTLTGLQYGSTTKIQGPNPTLQQARYRLDGKVAMYDSEDQMKGSGCARIKFTKESGVGEDVCGRFFLKAVGEGRLWMISIGAKDPGTNSEEDELVSAEAIRLS